MSGFDFGGSYPPGVTGREYEIAGPDTETQVDDECPKCGSTDTLAQTYGSNRWFICTEVSCNHSWDDDTEYDPEDDRADRDRDTLMDR